MRFKMFYLGHHQFVRPIYLDFTMTLKVYAPAATSSSSHKTIVCPEVVYFTKRYKLTKLSLNERCLCPISRSAMSGTMPPLSLLYTRLEGGGRHRHVIYRLLHFPLISSAPHLSLTSLSPHRGLFNEIVPLL